MFRGNLIVPARLFWLLVFIMVCTLIEDVHWVWTLVR